MFCETGGKCFLGLRGKGKRGQGRSQSNSQESLESDDKDFVFYSEQDEKQLKSFGHSS